MADPRRAVLLPLVVVAVVLGGACGDDEEPLRIGVLTECSGLLEAAREGILASAQLPLLDRGGEPAGERPSDGIEGAEVAGRPVEIVEGCTEITALTRQILETRRLVEEEKVDVVIGPAGEVEGALASRLARRYPDTTFVLGASAAQEATLADPRPNVFRFTADGAQSAAGLGSYAFRELGWRHAAVVMDPVPASWEAAAGFVAEFCSLGGSVVERPLLLAGVVPGGAQADRLLGERLAGEVDGTMLISGFYPPTAFLRGYGAGGRPLAPRLLLNGFGFLLPGGLAPGGLDLRDVVLGSDIPPNLERAQWHAHARALARAYPALGATARDPLALPVYTGAEAVARALEDVGGEPGANGRDLRRALGRIRFEAPAGPLSLDANRQAVVDVHLRRLGANGTTTRPLEVVHDVRQDFGGWFRPGAAAPSVESPACPRARGT